MTDAQARILRFAGYRLGKRLGGSNGRASYLAEREGSRPVTCVMKKLEPPMHGLGPLRLQQFDALCRQVDLMRRLEHPGIVKTIAHHLPAGHTHGIPGSFVCIACQSARHDDAASAPFLVMEHLHGLALDRVARAQARTGQPLPPAMGAYVVHELARALGHVHGMRDERGRPLSIVHGQLRPKEVMLLRGGEVKLLPFGTRDVEVPLFDAAPLRGGPLPGVYLAPEQLLGRPVDGRADVFALGAILWELLVGVPLFGAGSENDAIGKVLACEVPRPSSLCPQIPSGLDVIVTRALARDPARRHPSTDALAEDLVRGLPPRSKLLMHTASLISSVREPGSRVRSAGPPPIPRHARSRRTTPVPPPLPMPTRRTTPLPTPIESLAIVASDKITMSPAPTETSSRPVRLPPPVPPVRQSSVLSHLTRLAVVAVVAFGGGALWHQHRARSYTSLGVAPERPEVVPLGPNGPLVQNPAVPDGPTPTLALPAAAAASVPAAPATPAPAGNAPAPTAPAPPPAPTVAAASKASSRPQRRTRFRAKVPRRVQALR